MAQNILYLAVAEIRIQEYMGSERFIKEQRIVFAQNESEAYAKYNEFWRSKTSEYATYYSVQSVEFTESLL